MMRNPEALRLEVLALVGADGGPVGARQISRMLQAKGMSVSESTISRVMRRLDEDGLTVTVGTHGRMLSKEGNRYLSTRQASRGLDKLVREAVDVRTIADLIDLFAARCAVETESARSAAVRSSPEHVERLRSLIVEHEAELAADNLFYRTPMEFHRAIAAASENRVLIALTDIILGPQQDRLEVALSVIVDAHQKAEPAIDEHTAIVDAIEAGQEEAAAALMSEHLHRLIREVETYASDDKHSLFQRLLAWTDQRTLSSGSA